MKPITKIRKLFALSLITLCTCCRAYGQQTCDPASFGTTINIDQVATLAHNAGFRCRNLAEAIAIAGAESEESGGDYHPKLVCTNPGPPLSQDWGLWQANDLRKNAFGRYGCENCAGRSLELPSCALDSTCGTDYAYLIWSTTGGWGNWATFNTPPYLDRLPAALDYVARNFSTDACNNCKLVNGVTTCPPIANDDTVSKQIGIVTSIDPNDKTGFEGFGAQRYLSGRTPLAYAISFGNLASASAAAREVSIVDQLDPLRDDFATVSLGPIAFGATLTTPVPFTTALSRTIDLRPANNLLVKIDASFDSSTGLLKWHLTSLDPSTNQPPLDPALGFLPPGGDGSVVFTVMSKISQPTNTEINNQASIVFDANAPIATQIWFNTIDNDKPSSHILPLPAHSPAAIPLQWTGSDVGAGLQDFTVFASDNGDPFTPFLTNTAATSATFTGQIGHTYAFYSIARDLVGNVEPSKSAAEATTQVVLNPDTTPPTSSAMASPSPNSAGWNNSNVTVSLSSLDDPTGTGVEEITFSGTGAQSVASTTVPGATTSLIISSEGVTTTTFFGTDNAGNVEAPKTITVKLDKTPPTISGTLTPTPNSNGWNNSTVTATFQCADSLSGLAAGSPPAPTTISTQGANQSVTGTCQDVAGNSASATLTGINIDTTPPAVTCSVTPSVLWPPNNKLVPVNATVTVIDSLSGSAGFNLVSVTSNEPDSGQGDIQGFVPGTPSVAGQLRAQRLGTGPGRVYTLTYAGLDRAGNSAACTTIVTVPHDQGH